MISRNGVAVDGSDEVPEGAQGEFSENHFDMISRNGVAVDGIVCFSRFSMTDGRSKGADRGLTSGYGVLWGGAACHEGSHAKHGQQFCLCFF